jgi:CheY-like chemotaxis protein
MGGNIKVKSRIGKGSAFYFTLPAKKSDFLDVFSPVKFQDKHILVVDDNATNRRILSLRLQRWHCKVKACADGESALSWLKAEYPCDVGLLDMAMPGMNGLQLALQIHQLSHRQHLPLIMLSSIDKIDIDLELSQSLFAAYLCKPIKRVQLFDTLAGVLNGQHHRHSYENNPSCFCDRNLAKQFPLRILLAEDDPVSQQLETLLFQNMGYAVDIVNNGMEVLEILHQQTYHLIFMDVQMPLMNGFVTTSAILDQYSPAHRPKIIAITASALEEDKKRCLAAGMDDYLRKPVQYQEMRAVLEKWGRIYHSNTSIRELPSLDGRTMAHSSISLLDLKRVEEIKILAGTRFLPKIIQPFLSQSTELVDNITLLTQQGDAEALGKVVHQLKGSSASLGATYLANLCKQIELKSRQRDWSDIQTLCTELKVSYAQTQDQLMRIGQLYG